MEWHLLSRMKTMQRAQLSTGCCQNPQWKARYIAHVRTVIDEWLDWKVLEPLVNEYQALIDTDIQQDDKKLYAYQNFAISANWHCRRRP